MHTHKHYPQVAMSDVEMASWSFSADSVVSLSVTGRQFLLKPFKVPFNSSYW